MYVSSVTIRIICSVHHLYTFVNLSSLLKYLSEIAFTFLQRRLFHLLPFDICYRRNSNISTQNCVISSIIHWDLQNFFNRYWLRFFIKHTVHFINADMDIITGGAFLKKAE